METKFFQKLWENARQDMVEYLTILICSVVIIFSVFDVVDLKIVTEAILAVLLIQAYSLLKNHHIEKELKQSLKELMNQQNQSRLSDTIIPFGDRVQEINRGLTQADEVWILSRTCQRLWVDYQDELQNIARRNGLKLLLLDPSNGAFNMIEKSTIWQQPGDGDRHKIEVSHFVSRLDCVRKTLELNNFEMRVIDYLPAWTLILINPRRNDGVVYVEMATYRAHSRKRPSFVLNCDLDNHLYDQFRNEFEQMWDDAKPAWNQTQSTLINNTSEHAN